MIALPGDKMTSKTSDQGWTRMRGSALVRKNHALLEFGGELDELEALLGAAAAHLGRRHIALRRVLEQAQSALLDAGCSLGDPVPARRECGLRLAQATKVLDRSLARLNKDLPPLRGFVLPGGSAAGSWLHVARAVCRRVERGAVSLPAAQAPAGAAAYLNRLSKWLFAAACWVNAGEGRPETAWTVP
jgi:cob(I)alamin adenosyltransferase